VMSLSDCIVHNNYVIAVYRIKILAVSQMVKKFHLFHKV